MSGANSPQGGLTRRSFLRTTAAVTGAAALTGAGSMTALAEYNPGQVEAEGEHLARCVCRPNCFGYCNINVHVRDGKVVKTSKRELPEFPEYSRICQRGLTHVERIYNEERLKYPMRRVEGTDRGAGEWERVSWDEAIDEIATKITETQDKYGKQAVAFCSLTGNYGTAVTAMYNRLKCLLGVSTAQPCNDIAIGYAGKIIGDGNDANELTDAVNADTIIVYGANITDAQVHHWHHLKKAQANGTKIVVVDPSYTVIASKADRWISIRPGSDTLLYFGMMNIMMERGAIDEEFMANRTVAPFLVREDDGAFLRDDAGNCLVLEGDSLKAADEAAKPELFAEYVVDGVKCSTALKLQMDIIAEWTPEIVSEKTDIPVETINELVDYYLSGSVYAILGYGPLNYQNGAQMAAAGFMTSFLCGNYGKPGSTYGMLWSFYMGYDYTYGSPVANTTMSFSTIDWVNIAQGSKLMGQDFPVKMAYFYFANPVNTAPNVSDWRDIIFPSLDYIVVADSAMTDTARFADLVLPTAQHFECEDFTTASCTFSMSYNEKAIDPPFEAKSDCDIVRIIADKMGLGGYFEEDDEELCRQLFEIPSNLEMGYSWENLKEKGFLRWAPKETHIAYPEKFGTATGRAEFYTEAPKANFGRVGTRVPTEEEVQREHLMIRWEEPSENWYENEKMKEYPLSFLSFRGRFRVHSQYFTVGILHEIDPEPILYVNPIDAQARGVEDGGYVEAFNDRGHAVGRAVYSEGIRPGTVAYPKGWQISQHKAGSWSELLNPDFSLWTHANNFPDCICDIRPWNEEGENR